MKKYRVIVEAIAQKWVEVEAEDAYEAEELAIEKVKFDESDFDYFADCDDE